MLSDYKHFGKFVCHLNRRERKIGFSPFDSEAILPIDRLEARKRDKGKWKYKTLGLKVIVMFCHIAVDLAVFVGFTNSVDDGTSHTGNQRGREKGSPGGSSYGGPS